MKKQIEDLIGKFVRQYENRPEINTKWGTPLVGFGDACHKDIRNLRETVIKDHQMPQEIIANPTIIISYFLPFKKEMAMTNAAGELSSPRWANAYKETNALFIELNEKIIENVKTLGYDADVSLESLIFDKKILKSRWSQRHIAKLSGLGSFGLNNLLITKKGSCGRFSSVVTSLPIEPDEPTNSVACNGLNGGTCRICAKRCPAGAIQIGNFDREKCFTICKINNKVHGNYICGKCAVNIPCAFIKNNSI